jgi:hypothetical protein
MDFLKKGLEAAKKAGNKAVNQIKEVRTLSAVRCPPAARACLWRASTHSTPPLSAPWPHAAARAGLGSVGIAFGALTAWGLLRGVGGGGRPSTKTTLRRWQAGARTTLRLRTMCSAS